MHELQVTERILNVVLQHTKGHDVTRVVRIHLRIGELSDLEDEWIQHYFEYIARDTLAANAELAITRAPIVVSCAACSRTFEIKRDDLGEAKCPDCGEGKLDLVSGREYLVENMEVM